MSKVDIDDDARRLMTPEELQALDEDYDPEADNAAAAAAAAEGSEAGADDAGDQGTEGDATGAPAAPAAPAAPTPAAAGEVETPDPIAPVYTSSLPEDFDAQVQANKQARKELRTKFNNGDLDDSEFEAEQDRLDEERLALVSQQQRAAIAEEMSEQARQNAWIGTINTFMADAAKSSQVDYRKDQAKQDDLDTFVKMLANAKGNENKPMRWYLDEAHKRVLALHGMTPSPAKPVAADVARRPNVESIPANLSGVAGAGGADPMDDEFAALDKLTGLDAERALASMSPEKQRLYAQRA